MILDTIVEKKKEEVSALKNSGIVSPSMAIDPPRGFIQALIQYEGVAIIAEAKKASPSKGIIDPDFDPVRIAKNYKAGGAQAMSVLTDESFFQGSLDYLPLIRSTIDLPVLRKDFMIDEIQIHEAGEYGADAILLIAAILDRIQLRDYRQVAEELGMDVLVEVHDQHELEDSLEAGSRLIGINNRNLKDFTVSLDTTYQLMKCIPKTIPVVSESGIRTKEDMKMLRQEGLTAALIGETLMRSGSQDEMLHHLRDE